MNLDQLYFDASQNCGEAFCQSFIKHGRERTSVVCKATIESSIGALRHLEGEMAAFNFVQRLADDIVASMIEKRTE